MTSEIMRWPALQQLEREMGFAEGTSLRLLRDEDLEAIPGILRSWYPAVAVGGESVFLDPAFLRGKVVREGELDRDLLAVLILQSDQPVAFMSFEREPANLTLHGRLGVLAPDSRAGFLGALGFLLFEKLGRLCGAELLLTWVTLASRTQQMFAERRGFKLVGIVPAFDRDQVTQERSIRVAEALMAKTLAANEEILNPSLENLTTRTRKMWELIESGP